MDKEQILQRIQDCGIVAVVRAESVDEAMRITDACIEGGVAAIEPDLYRAARRQGH